MNAIEDNEQVSDWAARFDESIKLFITRGDHQPIVHCERMGESAHLAVPTNEHFLPLLYALGLRNPGEPAVFFTEKVTMCSLSMRSFMLD